MLHRAITNNLGEKIFDKTKIGLALVSKDGEFLRANAELCKILGYSEAELQEKTFAELTDPRDFKGDQSMLEQVLLGNIDEYSMLKRYITKNGKIVWATLIVAGIHEDTEEVAFFFSQIIPEDNNFFQQLQEKNGEDDDIKKSESSFDNKLLAFLKKEWKYIFILIAAIITFEVNRRTTEIEKNIAMTNVTEMAEENSLIVQKNSEAINNISSQFNELLVELRKDKKDE